MRKYYIRHFIFRIAMAPWHRCPFGNYCTIMKSICYILLHSVVQINWLIIIRISFLVLIFRTYRQLKTQYFPPQLVSKKYFQSAISTIFSLCRNDERAGSTSTRRERFFLGPTRQGLLVSASDWKIDCSILEYTRKYKEPYKENQWNLIFLIIWNERSSF